LSSHLHWDNHITMNENNKISPTQTLSEGENPQFVYQEAVYNTPTTVEIPPGLRSFHEVLRLSPEEAEQVSGIEVITAANSRDAQEGSHTAKAFALADALYASDPGLSQEFEDALSQLEENTGKEGVDYKTAFTEWASKHGRLVLAPLAVVAGLGVAPTAQAGLFDGVRQAIGGQTVNRTLGTIENYERMQREVAQIEGYIAQNEQQIIQLQAQIDALLAQGQVASRVEGIESSGRVAGASQEQNAQLRLALAQINAERAKREASFLSIPNPTQVQIAEYELAIAQFDVAESRARTQHGVAGVRTGGQGRVDQAEIDRRNSSANQYITYYRNQQADLRQRNNENRTRLLRIRAGGIGQIIGR
jgi:hypothetical protein